MNAQVKAKALKPLWRIENAAQAVFDPVPFKVYTQRDLERIPNSRICPPNSASR